MNILEESQGTAETPEDIIGRTPSRIHSGASDKVFEETPGRNLERTAGKNP